MKTPNLLVILVFLSGVESTHAQFPNFPDSNAVWLMDVYGQQGFIEQFGYYMKAIDHDTLINGTWYNSLWTGVEGQSGAFAGGLRGDDQKRIYYFHPNTNSEYLLYDFDPSIGDTIHVWIGDSQATTYIPQIIHIVSIEQLHNAIGDQYEKIGIVNEDQLNQGGPEAAEYWIEGVGGTGGLLSTFGLYFYPMNRAFLSCMQHNDTIWPSGLFGICSPMGIQERVAAGIKVHPNPNQGRFTVHLPEGAAAMESITLWNAQGKRFPIHPKGGGRTMSVTLDDDIPSGLYLMRVQLDDGTILHTKIIIQP